jgi:UDP-2,3-diacylglucosamine hydrolase
VRRDFHAFLATVPAPGDHLLIIGDLFDFWFEYRRVIPREPFKTLSALLAARERGVHITIVGGNHDRWGGDFLSSDLGIAFFADGEAELELFGRRVYVHHGDGIGEQHWSSHLLHWITRRRGAIALFRAIHPDVGFWLADRLAGVLANSTKDESAFDRAAAAQEAWARAFLDRRPEIDVVVLGHTHRSALVELGARWYLNPGAFFDGGRYAVLTDEGLAAERFTVDGARESRSRAPQELPGR